MTATVSSPGATRQRLLVAAREVIEEGGYAAASVATIARRAGLAAGTLYRHFASKQALFVEVFRAVAAREERAMRLAGERMGPSAPAVARLEMVFATFARRALANPRLAWALLAEPVDPLVDAERLAHRARYAEFVAVHLREAIAMGEIPAQDVGLTAAALVGGCGEALVGPLSPLAHAPPISARDPEEVVASLGAFVRRAVGAV